MDETMLVRQIDRVVVGEKSLGLHKVYVRATHNSSAGNPRLVPMPSDNPETLRLGFYVESGPLPVMTPVEAELEFIGFLRVCVLGQDNEVCVDVPQ